MVDDERTPVELERVEPLLFGTIPPLGVLAIGLLGVLIASALLASGHWASGALLLALGLVALALFLVAARHRQPSHLARRAAAGLALCRGHVRFVGNFGRAWSTAGRELLGVQREARRTRKERERAQHELGDAAYRDDAEATAALRARMQELDESLRAVDGRVEDARARARARVERARFTIGTTEVIKPSTKG